jgi:hypothetical protein
MVHLPIRRCEMAKKFMYVCLGILALVAAFHIGANSATSQPTETAIDFQIVNACDVYVLTDLGNIYWWSEIGSDGWQLWVNFPGASTTTHPTTWGKIKAEFGE